MAQLRLASARFARWRLIAMLRSLRPERSPESLFVTQTSRVGA
jgi:hypothetical protein